MTTRLRPNGPTSSRRRGAATLLALFAAGSLAACASDEVDASSASTAPTGDASTTVAAGEADDTLALEYTGGTAGPADDSLDPVVIGWVNQQGGQLSLPYHTSGVEVAVELVNQELGGVDGRPVELRTCFIQAPPDGQRCGTELLNDPDVDVVLSGINIVAGQQLYSTLAGRKPVLVGLAVTPADTGTEGVFAFSSGDVLVRGMSAFVSEDLGAESVSLLYTDNPSGRSLFSEVIEPILTDRGVDLTGVPISSPATGPAVQQALVAAQASSADTIMLFVDPPSCMPAFEAISQSGFGGSVIATTACSGSEMSSYLAQTGVGGDAPDGWYFVNNGADAHIVDEATGMATYLDAVERFRTDEFDASLAYYGFSNLLTAVRLMNEIGPDNVTPESFEAALTAFEGPAIMFGDISCPGIAPNIGLCGRSAGIVQYVDGEWVTRRWGDDLIDTRDV